MIDHTPIPDVVVRLKALPLSERTRALQRMIGPVSDSPSTLQWRALLVTALRQDDV